ncbi:MAG: hypothetical protein ACM3WQ_02070 [Chloroflexota bacterium]
MKKIVVTLVLLLILLVMPIVSIQFVDLVNANPMGLIPKELRPIIINIQSPKDDDRVLSDQFTLSFIVRNPPLGGANKIVYRIQGFLSEVGVNPESYINSQSGSFYTEYSNYTYQVKVNATGLSDGWHSLAVVASGKALWSPDQTGVGGVEAENGGSDSINFLFDVANPKISILSPENKTYIVTRLPLNYSISEMSNWVGYCLDEQETVSITGNTTLMNLSEGLHTLTVYANDSIGRNGNSQTITFNIVHEAEGIITNQADAKPFPTFMIIIVWVIIVALVSVSLLIYFKKHKR